MTTTRDSTTTKGGGIQLLRGDCLRLLPKLAARSVALVLCDLPYGVTSSRRDHAIALAPLWAQYERVLTTGGCAVLFAQAPFSFALFNAAPRHWFRYEWIWDKHFATGFQWSHHRPMRRTEDVLVFSRHPTLYRPQGLHRLKHARYKHGGSKRESSDAYGSTPPRRAKQTMVGYPSTLLSYAHEQHAKPFQKPIALLSYLIHTYTRRGDLVLDNCMGTGSTGVACIETGRRFIGMEIDRKMFHFAEERITRALEGRA